MYTIRHLSLLLAVRHATTTTAMVISAMIVRSTANDGLMSGDGLFDGGKSFAC